MTSVLDLLRSPESPARAILRVLPGSGDRSDLVRFVAEAGAQGPVVVLVRSLVELDQWLARLTPLANTPVLRLASADQALQLEERDVVSRPGVILSTVQRVRSGPLMALLKGMEIQLLIIDGPTPLEPSSGEEVSVSSRALGLLALRARRTVVVVPGTMPFEWEGAIALRHLSEDDFLRATANVHLIEVPFKPSSRELELQKQANSLLESFLPRVGGKAVSFTSTSELHHRLLKVLAQPISPDTDSLREGGQPNLTPDEAETAWTVLDGLEDLSDSRLAALESVLRRPAEEGRPWLVTATLLRDVSYIADHLRGSGYEHVRELTTATDPSNRESILRFDSPRQIVVAGRLAYNLLDQWPPNCNAIWWSAPGSRAEFEYRMGLLATGQDVRVYQLTPSTPTGGTD